MTDEQLKATIYRLYEIIRDKIDVAKTNGKIHCIPHERIPAIDLDFTLDTYHFDWPNIEYFDRYMWESPAFVEFMEQEVNCLPETEQLADDICKKYDLTVSPGLRKALVLMDLVRSFIHGIPNEGVNNQTVHEYINAFLNDLDVHKTKKKLDWNVELWLGHIRFEGESLSLADNVTLRKPVPRDFDIVRPRSVYISETDKMFGRGIVSQSILSVSLKANGRPLVGLYEDKLIASPENWVDVLRLFKIGNVTVVRRESNAYSLAEISFGENIEMPFDKSWKNHIDHNDTSNYSYWLPENEMESLVEFANRMIPILETIKLKSYFDGDAHDLAFYRYKDALLRSEVNVNRIVSAMSCLEALLSESPGDITYKLSARLALLLQFFGFNPLEVNQKMKDAYKLRSHHVHGASLKSHLSFSRNSNFEILDYTRTCLLIFLQLREQKKKIELLTMIDNALVDAQSKVELEKIILDNVIVPKSQFHPSFRKPVNS